MAELDRFTIFFTPARQCTDCARRSHYGIAEQDDEGALSLEPRCFEHGYYNPEQAGVEGFNTRTRQLRQLEYESITRFVVAMHGEIGQALVIGPCGLSTVPGYVTPDLAHLLNPDKAWSVRYEAATEVAHLHVVFSYVEMKLQLYRDGHKVVYPFSTIKKS